MDRACLDVCPCGTGQTGQESLIVTGHDDSMKGIEPQLKPSMTLTGMRVRKDRGKTLVKRRVACASFAIVAVLIAAYSVTRVTTWWTFKTRALGPRAIQPELQPNEMLWRAAAGDLNSSLQPALVFGTLLHGGGSRIHVLHWQDGHYKRIWTFTHPFSDAIDELIIRDVNNDGRNDLVTLWVSGSGGFLDVVIFEWNGQTYEEIWNLDRHVKDGQLTAAASLRIRRADSYGNVELVIRTPITEADEKPGLFAQSHQVSIYRWDVLQKTFVLFKRFIDPGRTYE